MANISLLEKRFSELVMQLEAVEATKRYESSNLSFGYYVDNELLLNWKVKARSLIAKACGSESEHYNQFVKCECISYMGRTNYTELMEIKAVFLAAKEDYEGGYLNSIRNLVQAEVLDMN